MSLGGGPVQEGSAGDKLRERIVLTIPAALAYEVFSPMTITTCCMLSSTCMGGNHPRCHCHPRIPKIPTNTHVSHPSPSPCPPVQHAPAPALNASATAAAASPCPAPGPAQWVSCTAGEAALPAPQPAHRHAKLAGKRTHAAMGSSRKHCQHIPPLSCEYSQGPQQ